MEGCISYLSRHFLHGLTFYKSGSRWLVLPLKGVVLLTTLVLVGIAVGLATTSGNHVSSLCGFLVFSATIVLALWARGKEEDLVRLSFGIDTWPEYRHLAEDARAMKHQAVFLVNNISYFYLRCLFVGNIFLSNPYLVRLIFLQTDIKPTEILMFPCWTPFSLEESWTEAIIVQIFQTAVMSMTAFLYARVFLFCLAATVLLGKQVQLLGRALQTAHLRASKRISPQRVFTSITEYNMEYTSALLEELHSCVLHYQYILRYAKLLGTTCQVFVNVTLYQAMWLWCFLAVQVTKDKTIGLSVQCLLLLMASFCSSLLFSAMAEVYTTNFLNLRDQVYFTEWYQMPLACKKVISLFQVMVLRPPKMTTYLGTPVNLENFMKIVNTAYCYFGLIIATMDKK